ncbi:MAG: alpha-N-arabinofuranosidase [Prevotella sp.]|nr:alpha-N-arabinofuranosidase [Prevotella sp.]
MKKILLTAWAAAALLTAQAGHETVVSIDRQNEVGRISEGVYGFLLEHLYHSVSNGLWGECVWNRSFEELQAQGRWTCNTEGELTLTARGESLRLFRIGKLRNGVLRLDVRRTGGDGDIIIGVRDQHREQMLTNRVFLRLGKNDRSIESGTGWIWHTPVAKVTRHALPQAVSRSSCWTPVEIVLQDNRISVRVGGQLLVDREIADCPKDGAVTLGAVQCDVAFRHIRMTDETGKEVAANLNLSRHWHLIGQGKTSTDYDTPLNQDVALRVVGQGRRVGIAQDGKYYLRRNDPLEGSLFLKGDAKQIKVQLVSGRQVVGEQTVGPLTDRWQEYSLVLASAVDCHDATLHIVCEGRGTFWVDQLSLMHRSSVANGGYRPELAQAVGSLRPVSLRWPGGSFSEHYRFEYGIGPQHRRRGILRWDDFDPLSFGTDEFIAFCRRVGAEPVIVVPIGYHNYAGYAPDSVLTAHDRAAAAPAGLPPGTTDWLQRALDWLEYCNGDTTTTWGRQRARNGHPEPYGVKYWEIDNEVWKMEPRLYVGIARQFSMAMKQKDPGIKIVGCGCGRLGVEGAGLDSILISDAGRHFDYISPHYYQTIDKYGDDGVEEYGRYLDKLAAWIANSENPQMKIYLSEWNLDGVDMRTGLFAGGFLNRLERTPAVEMAAPALLLRHISAPGWNNSFINFDQDRWFAAPNYVVFRLWRDHYLPRRVAIRGDGSPLNMVATTSDDGREMCLKVVNAGADGVRLRIKNGRSLGNALWEVVSGGLKDANSMEQPLRIRAEKMPVSYDGQDILINIPAYSASVLSWTTAAR